MNAITHRAAGALFCIAAALSITAASCSIRVLDTSRLLDDFRTEGFLDGDHFQVIVKGRPDPSARGLVGRRESALKEAESGIAKAVAAGIGAYRLDRLMQRLEPADRARVTNLAEVRAEIDRESAGYIKYGYRAFEYYNEDHSAAIVFRIYRKGLQKSLESGGPKLSLPEDAPKKGDKEGNG
ncbi:MAG TPA: hypothetical protein VLM75_16230 [Spirochaetota bacterium]|nr:hypothetical protein [Spirochaetota bacterium]